MLISIVIPWPKPYILVYFQDTRGGAGYLSEKMQSVYFTVLGEWDSNYLSRK